MYIWFFFLMVMIRLLRLLGAIYRGSSAYAVFLDFGKTTVLAENRVSGGVI